MHELVFYTRAGCSLCEEAKEAIDRARRELEFTFREVDIDADPALFATYRTDVPVIEIDGRRAFKHRVGKDELLARLAR